MIFIFRFNIAKVPLFSKIVLLPKMHNALIENSGIAMASGLAKTGLALKQNETDRCKVWEELGGFDWLSRCIAHICIHAPWRCDFNHHHHEHREGADTGDQCSFGPFCFQREYGELCFNATSGMCLGTCSAHCSDGLTFLWRTLHCPPIGHRTSDLPSKLLLSSQGSQGHHPQWHVVGLVLDKAARSKGLRVRRPLAHCDPKTSHWFFLNIWIYDLQKIMCSATVHLPLYDLSLRSRKRWKRAAGVTGSWQNRRESNRWVTNGRPSRPRQRLLHRHAQSHGCLGPHRHGGCDGEVTWPVWSGSPVQWAVYGNEFRWV